MLKTLLLAMAGVATSLPAFASGNCYALYDAKNKLVRQTQEPLVDMSQPIAAQTATLFPGHFLIVTPGAADCTEVDELSRAQAKPYDGAQRNPSESPIFQSPRYQPLRANTGASRGLSEPTTAGQGGSSMSGSGSRTYSAPSSSSSSSSSSSRRY